MIACDGYILIKCRLPEKHFVKIFTVSTGSLLRMRSMVNSPGFFDTELYGHIIGQGRRVGHNQIAQHGDEYRKHDKYQCRQQQFYCA